MSDGRLKISEIKNFVRTAIRRGGMRNTRHDRDYILRRYFSWGQMGIDALANDKDRPEANHEILRLLWQYFSVYPGVRFHQALINLDIVKPGTDQYYVESAETLRVAWKAFDETLKL